MDTKVIISASDDKAPKLKVLTKKKENVRPKPAVTAKNLSSKAKQIAVTAKKNEAEVVVVLKEKESDRRKLVVTAKQLAVTAKKKESIGRKLAVTAGELRRKARQLAVTAKGKENVRRKLAVRAGGLRRKAKHLAVRAKGKEHVRRKLVVTAKKKENVRSKLVVTAKVKENVRRKLAVTAGALRRKAKQLAVTAREKESVRHKLAVTAEGLRRKAKQLAVTAKELGQARAKEEAILASIGDGVMACNKDGRVMLFNRVAEVLTGFSAKEAIGRHYSQTMKFVKDGSGKPSNDFIGEAIAKQQVTTMSGNTLLIRKDGRKTPVADSAAPIHGASVGFVGCVVVFRDVTRERAVDKAKNEFVSLASHQLRTPLTTVSWFSERLLGGNVGALNDKQKEYLDEVYKGNQRMVVLVNALLNVSRLELGTFVVEPEPTDVVQLARQMIDELKPQIDQRHLKFTERHAEKLPLLNADPKLLGMVFQNLLSNAVKYTPDKGSVSIDLRLIKRNETINKHQMGEDSIAIIVSDTGFGIPENQQYKIFTKLFRADNVQEKDTEGTGLGLYIVKSVVEHSGGMIWFTSEENKGTTFYVTLPLAGMKKKEGTKALE